MPVRDIFIDPRQVLQAFVPVHDAVALPEQELDIVALAIAEHEHPLPEGNELHRLLDLQG